MANMFSKAIPGASTQPLPEIAKPKPIRMASENDPAVLEAAKRTREAMLQRRGRLSTILTDMTKDTIGSSGKRLGA